MGLVTATYLSREMAHKFKMEAVHIHTSTASHILHHTSPNIQTCNKRYVLVNIFEMIQSSLLICSVLDFI